MQAQKHLRPKGCLECAEGVKLGFDITMAFQPIVNINTRQVFAQEALVRGLNKEPAGVIFEKVDHDNRYRFDQTCRVTAIRLAAALKIDTFLSINFMPNAVYQPELCIRASLQAAEKYGFQPNRILFEFTEGEQITDHSHIRNIIQCYKEFGFKTAIDDFGAGYAGLNLLAELQTDFIKLDMALIRNIHTDKPRQAIVKGILQVCNDLGIKVIAEGIECAEEMKVLQGFAVELFQGYFFARPAFESLASVNWE